MEGQCPAWFPTWQDSGLSSGVGHHQRDALLIGAIHYGLGLQMTLLFRRFVIEKVIVKGAATHELASTCCFEPLGGCFAGLELGHGSGCTRHKRQP